MLTDSGRPQTVEFNCRDASIRAAGGLESELSDRGPASSGRLRLLANSPQSGHRVLSNANPSLCRDRRLSVRFAALPATVSGESQNLFGVEPCVTTQAAANCSPWRQPPKLPKPRPSHRARISHANRSEWDVAVKPWITAFQRLRHRSPTLQNQQRCENRAHAVRFFVNYRNRPLTQAPEKVTILLRKPEQRPYRPSEDRTCQGATTTTCAMIP